MSAYTWEQLATATLRRQFPRLRGRGDAAVVELVRRVGPIQSQVARAPFVAIGARLPGAAYGSIVDAHERLDLVRGSSLRGTVQTSVSAQHGLLDVVTRGTLEGVWRRVLGLDRAGVDRVRDGVEEFATGAWCTPDQLREHLSRWLAEHESEEAARRSQGPVGRHLAHGHSALVRRPLTGSRWDRQTAPAYRSAPELLGEDRSALLADPDGCLVDLVRTHLRAFGPATRADIAWWSGAGLRRVDGALESLREELTARPGPRGATYYDVGDPPGGGLPDPGVRLLPEFDALLLGYDPKGRDRFVDPAHVPYYAGTANGVLSAIVLAQRRIAGSWRLVGSGDAASAGRAPREVEVRRFPGAPRLTESDLADAVAATASALSVTITGVRVLDASA